MKEEKSLRPWEHHERWFHTEVADRLLRIVEEHGVEPAKVQQYVIETMQGEESGANGRAVGSWNTVTTLCRAVGRTSRDDGGGPVPWIALHSQILDDAADDAAARTVPGRMVPPPPEQIFKHHETEAMFTTKVQRAAYAAYVARVRWTWRYHWGFDGIIECALVDCDYQFASRVPRTPYDPAVHDVMTAAWAKQYKGIGSRRWRRRRLRDILASL